MAIGSRYCGSEDGPADILYNGTTSDVSDGGDAARRPRRLMVYRISLSRLKGSNLIGVVAGASNDVCVTCASIGKESDGVGLYLCCGY